RTVAGQTRAAAAAGVLGTPGAVAGTGGGGPADGGGAAVRQLPRVDWWQRDRQAGSATAAAGTVRRDDPVRRGDGAGCRCRCGEHRLPARQPVCRTQGPQHSLLEIAARVRYADGAVQAGGGAGGGAADRAAAVGAFLRIAGGPALPAL